MPPVVVFLFLQYLLATGPPPDYLAMIGSCSNEELGITYALCLMMMSGGLDGYYSVPSERR